MSLSHQQARNYMQAAVDGLLDPEALSELYDHLDNCPRCRAHAAQLGELETLLARSLQVRWPRPNPHDPTVRESMARVQTRVRRRHWFRRAYDLAQAVAWAGLTVALVIVVGRLFETVTPQLAVIPGAPPTPTVTPAPTATPEIIVESVKPTPAVKPPQARTLTICMGSEPPTLYLYDNPMLVASHVHEAIYDGPIDNRSYSYQPIIIEKLPSLADGDAITETVVVQTGNRVIDDSGQPVVLAKGVLVRPAGCYDTQCAVIFDDTPLEMERMVVTFTLKAGIHWSDGEPLTAYDSIYSFELDQDPDTPSDKWLVERTARYEALDDYTVIWTGLPGHRDSEYFIRFWTPLPAHAWGMLTALELTQAQESTRQPLGWGPYAIKEWISGDRITLARNEHYWRAAEGLPKFETVVYRFVGESANANIVALLSGECDILDQTANLDAQAEMLLELQAVGKLNATFVTGTVWEHADFGINPVQSYDRPNFFQDVRVRQAIAYCMDRQAIADTVLFGQSQVLDTYLPPEHPLFNPDVKRYPFDPQTGAVLLESVGWIDDDGDPQTPRMAQDVAGVPDGTRLAFDYWTTSAEQRQAATRILQASLAECGVQMTVEYLASGELFADGPGGPVFGRHFDMAQFAWLIGVRPPCDLYLSSQIPREENNWAGQNNAGFSDVEYDAVCQAAMHSLPGTPEYEQLHRQAQHIFAEQLPVVPLYSRLKLAATRPDMHGFIMDPTANSEFWNIEAFDYQN
jgi:peptide/nickel transport system substrate-binding protein